MINWKVRIKNKYFWLSAVPFVAVVVSKILEYFGYTFTVDGIGEIITNCIEFVFYILIGLGIITDNTTAGISDSYNALNYTKPKEYIDNETGE